MFFITIHKVFVTFTEYFNNSKAMNFATFVTSCINVLSFKFQIDIFFIKLYVVIQEYESEYNKSRYCNNAVPLKIICNPLSHNFIMQIVLLFQILVKNPSVVQKVHSLIHIPSRKLSLLLVRTHPILLKQFISKVLLVKNHILTKNIAPIVPI